MQQNYFDTIVCGSGPAGLAAAYASVRSGQSTLLLEKLPCLGRKLLASGGGKCNFSNTLPEKDFMNSFGRNGRFMTDALRAGGLPVVLNVLKSAGVESCIVDDLYYFPKSGRASDIRDAFLIPALSAGLKVLTDTPVQEILVESGVLTGVRAHGTVFHCRKFVLAPGGTAMPALGGTPDGLRLAESVGHTIMPPLPAMAPVCTAESWIPPLSGVSLPDAELRFSAGKSAGRCRGEILFTHDGLSGPAALSLSGPMYQAWNQQKEKFSLRMNVTADRTQADWTVCLDQWRRKEGDKLLRTSLGTILPRSAASALTELAGLAETKNQNLKNADRDRMVRTLTDLPLRVAKLCPMEKAMAMSGGVRLKEVDPRTMGSRLVEGLFFAGEILDLTGPCGGFNIQFALASGILAGGKGCSDGKKAD